MPKGRKARRVDEKCADSIRNTGKQMAVPKHPCSGDLRDRQLADFHEGMSRGLEWRLSAEGDFRLTNCG